MAEDKRYLPNEDAWRKIQSAVQRLQSQYGNLFRSHIGVRHAANAGIRVIEFSLNEDLSRGETKKANHLPFGANEQGLGEIDVTEKGKLASGVYAPSGTTGYAVKVAGPMWLIINLDCDKYREIE